MNANEFIMELGDIGIIINTIKIFFISLFTYYVYLRICNIKSIWNKKLPIIIIMTCLISMMYSLLKYRINSFNAMLVLSLLLSFLYSTVTKNNLGKSLIATILSLSINYIVYFIVILISFIPNYIIKAENDYINLFIMMIIQFVFIYNLLKIRRFKNGISFLQKSFMNEYFDMLVLNISVIIVISVAILSNLDISNKSLASSLFFVLIIFCGIMFITIQKTLTMYYKYKKLIEELNETKEELEKTKKDRDKVEQENIEISKTNHSISHKIKSLNSKINKLIMNSEIADEIDLKDSIDKINKEYNKEKVTVELSKTGIEVIDDMLNCMKEECIENNIEFELQISGNIHHMANNYIPKEELEILLADHIKDAIIAIKHTDNINRSILVRLGLIDEFYSLYIYDSGIEFEIDTLINLGTKPVTTHKDEGGTGMGFLNTFDTLRKHKASMIINEIGKPSKDNYTKVIMIKFDGKDDFKVKSYRSEEMKEINFKNNLSIV